jgi:hypothetical protein
VLVEFQAPRERRVPVLVLVVAGERASPVERGSGQSRKRGPDGCVELAGALVHVELCLHLAAGIGDAILINAASHRRDRIPSAGVDALARSSRAVVYPRCHELISAPRRARWRGSRAAVATGVAGAQLRREVARVRDADRAVNNKLPREHCHVRHRLLQRREESASDGAAAVPLPIPSKAAVRDQAVLSLVSRCGSTGRVPVTPACRPRRQSPRAANRGGRARRRRP